MFISFCNCVYVLCVLCHQIILLICKSVSQIHPPHAKQVLAIYEAVNKGILVETGTQQSPRAEITYICFKQTELELLQRKQSDFCHRAQNQVSKPEALHQSVCPVTEDSSWCPIKPPDWCWSWKLFIMVIQSYNLGTSIKM